MINSIVGLVFCRTITGHKPYATSAPLLGFPWCLFTFLFFNKFVVNHNAAAHKTTVVIRHLSEPQVS